MERIDMTQFDKKPEGMINYLRYNGPHFNEKLCDFAVSKMAKKSNGREVPITPFTKKEVDTMLGNYGITLENNNLRDYVDVANMCKADFLGSSIEDNLHVARYIKDVIDDDLIALIESHLNRKRFKGYKVEGVDIQLIGKPSRKKYTI